MMVGRLVDVCRRRGLKFNTDKSKVMLDKGLVCEVLVRQWHRGKRKDLGLELCRWASLNFVGY